MKSTTKKTVKKTASKKATKELNQKLTKKELSEIMANIELLGQEKVDGFVMVVTDEGESFRCQGKLSNFSPEMVLQAVIKQFKIHPLLALATIADIE